MENQVNEQEQNFSVSRNSTIYYIIIFSLIIATLCLSISMGVSFSSFCDHQQQYSDNIKSSKILRESYDNLTTQFRRFIITRTMPGLTAYFDEFDSGRRDAAIQDLSTGTEGGKLLSTALASANEITDIEIHAIALAAKASDLDFNSLRKEITEYPFTSEEKAMSKIELINKASSIAFGEEFGEASTRVDGIIDQYTSTLLVENADEVSTIQSKVIVHIVSIALCLTVLVILTYLAFSRKILQ